MERQKNSDILDLANNQIQQVIFNAMNCLREIFSLSSSSSSSIVSNHSISLRPNIPLRCRSSSNNRNDRKISFHNTIPRCSLPATKNDLVHYQSRLLSYQQTNQTHCRTLQTINNHGSNRIFDVQYSFSLNKPCLTKLDKQRRDLINIQNFVNELIENSIETALIQINHENLTSNHILINTDDTSYTSSIEYFQIINLFVDQFIHLTIKKSIKNSFFSDIEYFSNHLTENILTDVFSSITNNSIETIELINNEQQSNIFNSSLLTIDSIVNNLTQQIYINSFQELKKIFTNDKQKL